MTFTKRKLKIAPALHQPPRGTREPIVSIVELTVLQKVQQMKMAIRDRFGLKPDRKDDDNKGRKNFFMIRE
jgi:hypothetical protein